MKISFRLILAALAVTAALTACTKEITSGNSETDRENTRAEGRTFTAVIEQSLTKTTLTDANKIWWESGDRVNINGAEYSAVPRNPASKAVFQHSRGNIPQNCPYEAIYPASLVDADGGRTFPALLTYEPGKLNTPMYAESDTEELSFKNICGVLCFSLTGTETVKSITVTAKENICGPFTVDIEEDGAVSVSLTGAVDDEAYKAVTLDCGAQGVQLKEDNATKFYVYLPPQSYSAGLTFEIKVFNDRTMKKTTGIDVEIGRGLLYNFDWNVHPEALPEIKLLAGSGSKTWVWNSNGSGLWGNAGNSGDGAAFGPGIVDGQWWAVSVPEELEEQTGHSDGSILEKSASSDACMAFDTDGNITSYGQEGVLMATSKYSVNNYDVSRSSGWELGKLVTEEPAVLWPFSINEGGKTVTEFDIMYLDPSNMTLVYTKGNGAGSWGEITFWKFISTDYASSLTAGDTRQWTWNEDVEGCWCWGNAGNSGDGAAFGPGIVDGQWWGVSKAEDLLGEQLVHAGGSATGAESSDAYMEFSADGHINTFDGEGNTIYSSTYEVRNWDYKREASNGWELGKLVTEEPAVLWPFSINEGGKTVTEFDIMYLDPSNMTLVYTKGNGAGSWGEITFWVFKSKH